MKVDGIGKQVSFGELTILRFSKATPNFSTEGGLAKA
jgi:hypothetical protein